MTRTPLPLHRAALAAIAVLALASCGDDPISAGAAPSSAAPVGPSASAELRAPDGSSRGSVTLSFEGGGALVDVRATGLPPGVHGFHVHKTGRCEPNSADPATPGTTGAFLSAGGHLAAEGQAHGAHDGDLPPLIVGADGTASMTVELDRLSQQQVLDGDGSAVMVHALADNFANIPERYAPGGPDDMTKKTGDSGGRIACGALTAAG